MKYIKLLLCLVLAALIGCASGPTLVGTPVPPDVLAKWKSDPAVATSADLATFAVTAEDHYRKFHHSEGVLFQAWRTSSALADPDRFGSGGDSLIFTGLYLGATTYRYRVTKDVTDLDKMIEAVRGLYILTNAVGHPGNLARCAFPLKDAVKFAYPENWNHRIADGFVYEGPDNIVDPFDNTQTLPKMVYYTRVSRDQVSGLFCGLAIFLNLTDPANLDLANDPASAAKITKARNAVSNMVLNIWARFKQDDFLVRDQTGRNNTADEISGLLKLQIMGVLRTVDPSKQKVYEEEFESFFSLFGNPADWFNRFSNLQQYYAWNLRFSRTLALWHLEPDPKRQKIIADYIESKLFSYVKDHQNPYFIYVYNVAHPGDPTKLDEALLSLKGLTIRPFRNYDSPMAKDGSPPSGTWGKVVKILRGVPHFLGITDPIPAQFREPVTYFNWQEDPWEPGYKGNNASEEDCGLGFLLPYWMGRYYGFIK